jgi:hypothetical protein
MGNISSGDQEPQASAQKVVKPLSDTNMRFLEQKIVGRNGHQNENIAKDICQQGDFSQQTVKV